MFESMTHFAFTYKHRRTRRCITATFEIVFFAEVLRRTLSNEDGARHTVFAICSYFAKAQGNDLRIHPNLNPDHYYKMKFQGDYLRSSLHAQGLFLSRGSVCSCACCTLWSLKFSPEPPLALCDELSLMEIHISSVQQPDAIKLKQIFIVFFNYVIIFNETRLLCPI